MVQPLRDMGWVGRGPLDAELGWGEFTVGGVGPVGVVIAAPVLDDHPGFEQRVEAPRGEQLVTKAAVERFDPSVLPGRAGVDE